MFVHQKVVPISSFLNRWGPLFAQVQLVKVTPVALGSVDHPKATTVHMGAPVVNRDSTHFNKDGISKLRGPETLGQLGVLLRTVTPDLSVRNI